MIQTLTTSIITEQGAWRRRLVEALGNLVNFGATNTDAHYFTYLLVKDLEQAQREVSNAKLDWGVDSRILVQRQQWLRAQLATPACASVALPLWFARGSAISELRPQNAASILRSALRQATRAERQALAYTYAQGFADPSSIIHFSTTAREKPVDRKMLEFGVAHVFLLSATIVTRISAVLGLDERASPVAGTIQGLKKVPTSRDTMPSPGDFVVVVLDRENPFLAQVIESRETDRGTHGARVAFLGEAPYPGLTEDEVPSTHILPFTKYGELMDELLGTDPMMVEIPEAERANACRDAILQVWELAFRQVYLRHLETS